MKRFIVAAALLFALVSHAHADVSVGQAFGAWREYIDAIVSALIIGLVGIVLELLRRKLGISIEDSQRDALQTALTNGAGLALTKLGNTLDGRTLSTGHAAIDEAVNHVLRSAPGAVARFGSRRRRCARRSSPSCRRSPTRPAMLSAFLTWLASSGASLLLGFAAQVIREQLADRRSAAAQRGAGASQTAARVNAETVETQDAMAHVARPSDDAVADSL